MSTTVFSPVQKQERIHVLDILRGFASLGILLVNIQAFADTGWMSPDELKTLPTYVTDRILGTVIDVLVDTKFITLFSILFGVGFAIQLERAKAANRRFRSYFARRMAILLLIACIHAYLLWYGDIIRYYALTGLVLLLLVNWSNKTILRLALFFAVFVTASIFILNGIIGVNYTNYPPLEEIRQAFTSGSYFEVLQINWRIDSFRNFLQDSPLTISAVFGRVLLGYWLGRVHFFSRPHDFIALRRGWFRWGLCLGIPASVAFWAIKAGHLPLDSYWLLWLPYVISCGLILQSLFYISLVLRLAEKKAWQKRLQPFALVGRMALTNYLLQTCFGIVLFYGWFPGLHLRDVGVTYLLFISLLVFGCQVLISRWWLSRFFMGPVEWVWKALSYGKEIAGKSNYIAP